MVVIDPIPDGQRRGSRRTDPALTRERRLHPPGSVWGRQPFRRRDTRSLSVGATLVGVLLLAYLAIAEGVVDDRRQRFDDWTSAALSG